MTGLPLTRRLPARVPRGAAEAGAVVVFVLLYLLFKDKWTLAHDAEDKVFNALNDVRDWVEEHRNSNPVFIYIVNYLRLGIGNLFDALRSFLDLVSWPGLSAIAGAAGLVFAGWRVGLLAFAGVLCFGVLGLWDESMDTLALSVAAVLLSLVIGIPLGVLAGQSDRVRKALNPVLDVMQIMPPFAYLAPFALLFSIGAPAAAVVTMIYAIPAAIRITALAVRNVPGETVEASESLGSTRLQTLLKVQLPMARPTIALAVNQTIMMALSMVVITALIDGPGLGQNVIDGLERVNVGASLDAGLAVVVMAIVLDRLMMGAARRAEAVQKAGPGKTDAPRTRRIVLAAGAAVAVVGVVLGQVLSKEFPSALEFRLAPYVNDLTDWIEKNLFSVTDAIKNFFTDVLLNPLQDLLTSSPWWLVIIAVVAIGLRVSGLVPALVAGACLAAIAALGLWEHSMQTLAQVLVAVVITMAIGVTIGVLAARSRVYAAVQRPVLDAAQTMPSFVYLLPALALFSVGRFTAIAAAVIYAVPPVARLVEDGIRRVPETVVEAATAAGSTPRQVLWKVQLPMARRAVLLAANQGIVMILAMVVVGGMVGAGALGYDVVTGFSQNEDWGLGLAAGIATVLLGVMLDRITQGAGGRSEEFQAARKSG
ncbi:ABC transporter permease subunit [Actinomadura barringtoniae]|uniref:ABC transporter permease subunit n=1 Tax=Actinomadura barringtoniae TaxID=1427535 RepID=A0A939PCZ3_9ACTN|nr:ABC transporter permease subunit [Actinomadura barringtoniae]MBO2450088.1 ABC transporter permease subunit [Actinomadura barringtoniae]